MKRKEAILDALERYRSAAAVRGEAASCLVERARLLERLPAHERRRSELVDRAVAETSLEWDTAEEVYDLAQEEGLDPALAFELLHCGVLVHLPEDTRPTAARGDTLLEASPPEWLAGPPPVDWKARREARLRASFRRLRRLLEEHGDAERALVAFAEEPDVEPLTD